MTIEVRRRSYRPGGWFGIFGEHASVLLPPSEKARVPALWALVDEGAGFDEVLDALLTGGLRDLPGFVLVSETDLGTKVVLRGPAVAAFVADGAMIELAGSFDTTWVERSLTGVTQMFVQVEPTEDDGEDFTVASGLVRVARVEEPPYVVEEHLVQPGDDDTAEPPAAGLPDAPVDHEEPPIWEPLPEPADDAGPAEDTSAEDASAGDALAEAVPADDTPTEYLPVEDPPTVPLAQPDVVVPSAPLGAFGTPPAPYPPADVAAPFATPEPATPDLATPDLAAGRVVDATASGGWGSDQIERPQVGTTPQGPEPVGPSVARLLFSSGEAVDVDRVVLVGRAPEVRRFGAHDQPTLVTVPSPHQEISSTHLEVRPGAGIDFGSAVVTDLGSTNGTVLVQPGLPPEELQPGIAVQLLPGAIIDLGDGVTIQVTQP